MTRQEAEKLYTRAYPTREQATAFVEGLHMGGVEFNFRIVEVQGMYGSLSYQVQVV